MTATARSTIGVALLALVCLSAPAQVLGQSLDIKGVRIGMTEAEVNERIGNAREFTIGGVTSKNPDRPVGLKYHEGKLDYLAFYFDAKDFSRVQEAVKDKYPSIDCSSSTVTNAMGAKFEQVTCLIADSESSLGLRRFSLDIRTSSIILTSKRLFDEMSKRRAETKKDI